jgi:hypothetical protein
MRGRYRAKARGVKVAEWVIQKRRVFGLFLNNAPQ